MKRRNFLKKSITAGLASSAVLSTGKIAYSLGESNLPDKNYDLIAIKGGEPDIMFNKAIEAYGGMGRFVKKGQTVVVKPNIAWDATPERAGNTHPALIKCVIEHCLNAGAKTVYVFDHTCDNWVKSYRNSGIEKAAKEAGAKVVPGNSESNYQHVKIDTLDVLKEVKVHELILNSDVFINIPILKNHGSTKLTISMKNLMGIVWDRRFWHKNHLLDAIAEFPLWRKPDLNIVDAYRVVKRNGPRGVSVEDIAKMKYQLISTDIVAVDAASAKVFGMEPADVPYIKKAHNLNVGNMNLDELQIKRIAV
jgi:uncharacterized protein (DUF362 family)